MVSSRKIIYEIYRKLNHINTGGSQAIQVIDIVNAANEAYEIIVENNIKLTDVDPIIKANLRKLEVKNFEILPKSTKDGWVYFEYPDNLYRRLNHFVVASCKDCVGITKRIIPRVVQNDDLHMARLNPYRKANFAWEQLLMDEGGGGVYIYVDDSCIDIKKLVIDYYRKINYIQAPSLLECADYQYLDYDNKLIIKDVNFDLDNTYISRKVVDVAVLLLRVDIKDTEAFNLKLQQILQLQNFN
ncbi:MAG: hypothetical protein KBH21_00045 [Acetoanaerobium sp.]|nr:hypothetical protein [Acetoanaerobium sp.]